MRLLCGVENCGKDTAAQWSITECCVPNILGLASFDRIKRIMMGGSIPFALGQNPKPETMTCGV